MGSGRYTAELHGRVPMMIFGVFIWVTEVEVVLTVAVLAA